MIVQTDPEARKLYQFNDVIIKQAKMEEILKKYTIIYNCELVERSIFFFKFEYIFWRSQEV